MSAEEQPSWLQPYHWTSKNALLLECINQDMAAAAVAKGKRGRKKKSMGPDDVSSRQGVHGGMTSSASTGDVSAVTAGYEEPAVPPRTTKGK